MRCTENDSCTRNQQWRFEYLFIVVSMVNYIAISFYTTTYTTPLSFLFYILVGCPTHFIIVCRPLFVPLLHVWALPSVMFTGMSTQPAVLARVLREPCQFFQGQNQFFIYFYNFLGQPLICFGERSNCVPVRHSRICKLLNCFICIPWVIIFLSSYKVCLYVPSSLCC